MYLAKILLNNNRNSIEILQAAVCIFIIVWNHALTSYMFKSVLFKIKLTEGWNWGENNCYKQGWLKGCVLSLGNMLNWQTLHYFLLSGRKRFGCHAFWKTLKDNCYHYQTDGIPRYGLYALSSDHILWSYNSAIHLTCVLHFSCCWTNCCCAPASKLYHLVFSFTLPDLKYWMKHNSGKKHVSPVSVLGYLAHHQNTEKDLYQLMKVPDSCSLLCGWRAALKVK